MQFDKSKLAAVLTGTAFALATTAASAAVDVTAAKSELDGMIAPIGILGGAALLVVIAIKVWKRIRGAA